MAEPSKPRYYPVYLDLEGKSCVVLGGGTAATEKARGLVLAGADVTVVAKEFEPDLVEMGGRHEVRLLLREFREDVLDGAVLVIDASGDDRQGAEVAAAARRRKVLVNVLDRVPWCDFIAPAVVQRGPLTLAISTAGRSPFMASYLRRLLAETIGPEYGELVELVGELRDRLRADGVSLARQTEIYERVPGSGALELLRRGDRAGAQRAVNGCADAPAEVQPALF